MGLAHQIVVPSRYLQRVFQDHGYRARIVPNVVNLSRFVYRDRASLGPRLLSTRTLERNYGVDVVVGAFILIKAQRPDATLTIAGSGSETGRLRRMVEGIPGVTFLGRVRPERVPELCANADLFLNASLVDNQPLSLLEAFASGLPVVTTATGGIAALVRHGESGIIVPPGDAAAMAAAVLHLLRHQDRALGIARRAHEVARDHSWSRVRDQWSQVYSARPVEAAPASAAPGPPPSPFMTSALGPMDSAALGKEPRC